MNQKELAKALIYGDFELEKPTGLHCLYESIFQRFKG